MADQPKRRSMSHRFHPTSKEMLKYLLGFVIDEPLRRQDQVMKVVDVYAEKEPWQIVEGCNNNIRYFITPLKKGKEHHKRCKRSVGNDGTWRSQDAVNEVFDDKGRLMGYVHHLKYTNKSPMIKEVHGEWLMTEYSLCDGYVRNINKRIKYKGFVICKIKPKKKRSKGEDGENMVISEVEFDDFVKSLVQKEDINNNAEEEKNNENIGTSNINAEAPIEHPKTPPSASVVTTFSDSGRGLERVKLITTS